MLTYDVFYFTTAGKQDRAFDRDGALPKRAPARRVAKCVNTNGDGRVVWLNSKGERIEAPAWAR